MKVPIIVISVKKGSGIGVKKQLGVLCHGDQKTHLLVYCKDCAHYKGVRWLTVTCDFDEKE